MNKNNGSLNRENSKQKATRVRGAKRIEMIRQGLDGGKSRLRIAAELGVDEGTVRRDLKIAMLPESCLTAIEGGASAEQHLRSEQRKAAENAKRLQLALEKRAAEISRFQRLTEESLAPKHSDALAGLLVRWLNMKLPGAAYREQLLCIVGPKNWNMGDQMVTPSLDPAETLALSCQGQGAEPDYLPEKIEFLADALLKALPLLAPERMIRSRAIEEAKRLVQKS